MPLTIIPKKPFTSYTPEEQALILQRGEELQLCEQGESRSQEDTFCMVAYLQSKRNIQFKPTVEKIVKEKALTKAQKLEVLEQVSKLGSLPLTEKQQLVVGELVGVDKEYYFFTLPDGSKELMKMTKTNIKKKVKDLQQKQATSFIDTRNELTTSEQEFLTAMTTTGETNE